MATEISEISAIIVADAVRNHGLDGAQALSEGSLAKLHLCGETFIGRDAEELLWKQVSESTASQTQLLEGDTEVLIQLSGGGKASLDSIIAVPIRLFVETYIRRLADLIGLELCLRHLRACYQGDDYVDV